MAPFIFITALAGILALSASVTAQSGTGTGTGLPLPSATGGAPYPILNSTLPIPVPSASAPVKMARDVPVIEARSPEAPYPILPRGTGPPVGSGTGTAYPTATGYVKRMEMKEMRGLKQERTQQRKRGSRWW